MTMGNMGQMVLPGRRARPFFAIIFYGTRRRFRRRRAAVATALLWPTRR